MHHRGDFIEAGPWLNQDILFYRELNEAMRYCLDCYTGYSPSRAVRRIEAMLEATADYIAHASAYRRDGNYLRTKLALVLHAYQCLAYCLYPVMPALSGRILETLEVERDQRHAQRDAVRIAQRFDVTPVVGAMSAMQDGLRH